MNKVTEIINARVMDMLNNGVLPWKCGWVSGGRPESLTTHKPYNGVNVWLLNGYANIVGFRSNKWASFKTAQELGGTVRKGEHGIPVVFYTLIDDKDDAKKQIPIMRYTTVFNSEQIDGVKVTIDAPNVAQTVLDAEVIINNMPNKPTIRHAGRRAFYQPTSDIVTVPNMSDFLSTNDYYSTLYHEIAHATGHETRLNRDLTGVFGDHSYSKEELIAELTAAMLTNHAGLTVNVDNTAAYIAGWSKKIMQETNFFISAASKAQKAFDYITN